MVFKSIFGNIRNLIDIIDKKYGYCRSQLLNLLYGTHRCHIKTCMAAIVSMRLVLVTFEMELQVHEELPQSYALMQLKYTHGDQR